MDIRNFLEEVERQIQYKPIRKSISEELEVHLQEMKENYINTEKITEKQAEEKAVKNMGEPEEIGKKLNKIHRPKLDWKLLSLIIILVIYGIGIAISKQKESIGNTISYMLVGSIIGSILYFFDYRKMKKYANIIYSIAALLVIVSLSSGLGSRMGGVAYLKIGSILTFNASILAVPLFIIAFIGFLEEGSFRNKGKIKFSVIKKDITFPINRLKIILGSVFSLILILKIPSVTNAVILVSIYIILATIYVIKTSKNKKKILFGMYGSIIVFVSIFIAINGAGMWRIERLVASFKPEIDPQGSGYTGMLQKEILENAKMIGQADTSIVSTQENIIVQESNYAFIYIIGKAGILVALLLIIVELLVAIKFIINAKLVKDRYGKMLIIGLSALYILQTIITIFMNVNLGVQTNSQLPFVSEGGVYFIINCMCMACILSVYRRKDIQMEEKYIGEME